MGQKVLTVSGGLRTLIDLDASDISGGLFNALAVFDAAGVLTSYAEASRDVTYGGLNWSYVIEPDNFGGLTLNNTSIQFQPLQNSPNENWNINSIQVFLDTLSSGFGQGTNGSAVQIHTQGFSHQGTGNIGGLTHLNLTASLGNGTDPITVKSLTLVNEGTNVAANVTLDGQLQGYRFNPNVNSSAAGTSNFSVTAYADFANVGITSNGYESFVGKPTVAGIANNTNLRGFSSVPNVTTLSGNASVYGAGVYPTITTMGATSQVVGYDFNPTVTTMGESGGFQGVTVAGTITTSHGNINGINISTTVDGGDATYFGINISPQGTATLPSVRGINVFLGDLASSAQKYTFEGYGGKMVASSPYYTDTLPASPGFLDLNAVNSDFWVKPGDPTSNTLVFALNLGQNAIFEDDMGPDAFGGFLGYVGMALVTQGGVATTKTVDTVTLQATGLGIADVSGLGITDGGTISTVNGHLLLGALAGGGTVSINTEYGFRVGPSFGALSTDSWGFHNDSASENFMQRLALGTTTQKVSNSDIALELGNDKAARFANMSEATRDGLTALAGMVIFNTTSDCLEFYDGTAWQNCVSNVDGGTAGSVYGGSLSIDGGSA